MDALPFIIERLSETPFRDFLSKNSPHYLDNLDFVVKELVKVQRYMRWSDFKKQPEDKKQALIKGLRLTVRKVGKFMSVIHAHYAANGYPNRGDRDTLYRLKAIDELVKEWADILNIIAGIVYCCYMLKADQKEEKFALEEVYGENFEELERINTISIPSDNPYTRLNERESIQLLLVKAFPVLTDKSENSKNKTFLHEASQELDILPQLISNACHGLPLALVLVGSLLSFKDLINDIWKKVKVDLDAFNNDDQLLLNIMNYCYEDLPYFLKPCFLYLACYPKGYKISARSLINIWIAEGFISTERKEEKKEETVEETAYKYLEQLVERSLVAVTKRSFFGSIKHCCVNTDIHNFAIDQSNKEEFLVANPDERTIESLFRVAIHSGNNCHYGELDINHIHSFLALNYNQNILRNARFIRVLELLGSTVPYATIPKMTFLRYLSLRYTSIDTLPENIEVMQNLQTLDVRNTKIISLPESLWKISTLRHVYVKASPKIMGPPPTANITDLQTLKTVVVPKSWIDKCPQFLISLRKLSLSILDDLDWKSVSNLLSQSVNLLSFTIIGDSVPSELVDTRAFKNLETVKSIRLEGKWMSCRKLFIDNVKFPPNLTKLTLNKSGLKEDPMRRLEMIETLKFLSLQDGAYTGKQMACSSKAFPQLQSLELLELENLEEWVVEAEGFPQLQSLQFSKLKNLEKWVVRARAMSKLRKLHVVQCDKLNDIPELERATIQLS